MASTGGFAKKMEKSLANKRQRSTESANKDAPGSKRRLRHKKAGPPPQKAKKPENKLKVSEATKRHLIVALIEPRWKLVHVRLFESLFARMEEDPEAPTPTFDGAGWLNGVKIQKCMDDPTRQWLTQTVCQLEALWEGVQLEVVDRELVPFIPKTMVLFPIAIQALWEEAQLEVVDRELIPSIPKAKVPFLIAIQGDRALKLLQ
ncbi:uncharacterized protein Dyak_GE29177 [Drosophila yakuba]|uniref:DUF4780 domain-containing protein n=1 Tax=Drosophila yakuba TaxID=7245 RepID=A0A0R1DQG9_DROYA|nr:uncharacterized protein Dyak_GE29177 [Drosophila yakuba]